MDARPVEDLRRLRDDELGRALTGVATGAFPPTPDVASVVQARLEREALAYPELRPRWASSDPAHGGTYPRPRIGRVTTLAIVVLVLLAAIAAAVILGMPGFHLGFLPLVPS
jgi:hypothetical protein